MKRFRYSIVTPDGAIASGDCEFLLVPTAEGDIGILANHAPLLCELSFGVLFIRTGPGEHRDLYVENGYLEVLKNEASIMVAKAFDPSKIDRQAIAAEKAELEEKRKRFAAEHAFERLESVKERIKRCDKMLTLKLRPYQPNAH